MTPYEQARARIEAVLAGTSQWKVYAHAAPATFSDDLRTLLAGPPEPTEPAACPRPYPHAVPGIKYSEYLGFDGGSITIKTTGYDPNGSGWMCFEENALEWDRGEDDKKDYRILNLPNSELIAIRDKLCEVFPASPSPATEPTEEEVAREWLGETVTANAKLLPSELQRARRVQALFRRHAREG